jgi:hypothetical protein
MSVRTIECIVDHGQIRLRGNIRLPDNTKVYVVVPGNQTVERTHVYSPRLVHPEQVADFEMEIIEEPPHAGV